MCGIFGIWCTSDETVQAETIEIANRILRHRGPDDEGVFFANTKLGIWANNNSQRDKQWDLAFGFRRLSILDLTYAGHQPMSNPDGNLWIIFNGEIYNYIELRRELSNKGYTFQTSTDTEVILASYQEWGEDCTKMFNGMWGFAIWDQRQKKLFCSRDRFGIKPFYYSLKNNIFTFASEIKAILETSKIIREPNPAVIFDYLGYNLLDYSDETFYLGINQLLPAHNLVLHEGKLNIKCFWELELDHRGKASISSDYIDEFMAVFTDAIRLHLRSDVSVGTCLSGGLDSTSIACTMNRILFGEHNHDPYLVHSQQKTFSACFDNKLYDERNYIDLVLQQTDAEANYVFPTPQKFLNDIEKLIWHQEEPFGSLSIFAQWCVMEKIKEKGIKVTLDGQGGDEILAGYHVYFGDLWGSLLRVRKLRTLWNEWKSYKSLYNESWLAVVGKTMRTYVPASILTAARHYRNNGSFSAKILGVNPEFAQRFFQRNLETYYYSKDPINNSLYADLTRLSIPKLLHYEDRNSMAFSVEARVPFLDYHLVEYAFSLPIERVIRNGYTKYVLRQAMQDLIPEQIRLRKDKMGFVTPEKVWMANELKEWAYKIVHSESFCSRPYFDIAEIHQSFDEYVSGRRDLSAFTWRWLNLELWLRQMIEGENPISW